MQFELNLSELYDYYYDTCTVTVMYIVLRVLQMHDINIVECTLELTLVKCD